MGGTEVHLFADQRRVEENKTKKGKEISINKSKHGTLPLITI